MKNIKIDFTRFGVALAWIVLIIFFTIYSPKFISASNIFTILRQAAVVGICSVGMTFIILTGGMDLSVGSVIGVSCVGGALMVSHGVAIPVVMIIILIAGGLVGLFNAFFINTLNIAPIIMTLGTMTALRGVAYLLCGGFAVYGIPENYKVIGQGYLGAIPVPVIIMAGCFALGWILLNRFSFGRKVYGIGGNKEAARLSGVNVKKMLYEVYALAGMLYALAGLILMARVNSGQPGSGEGYEMDVITGVVLGGVSTSGGEGGILGVVIGVLLMSTLSNGMIIMGISDYWQRVVRGLVLILAVSLDSIVQKNKQKKAEKV